MALLTLAVAENLPEPSRNRIVRLALGGEPLSYRAGQHVLLGDHGQSDRRPYSIAIAPAHARRTGLLEFLIQTVDDDSPGPHLPSLLPGRLIDVEGPAGDFVLPDDAGAARSFLFVGGGTGIAPLRAMIWEVLETRPDARVSLVQTARAPEELAFAGEFRAAARASRLRLTETVTRPGGDQWRGPRGRIDRAQLAPLVSPDTLCFVCGPDSLVEEVPRLLVSLGVAGVRTERWTG